ncbi:MAG: polyisoprenoid-binding protein [Bacteroidetes bacterium]|nr:polyisoprenoid-binding protein [Bacteroidota bacterium]
MQTTESTTRVKWIADPMHTSIGFSVKHMMLTTVRGEFEKYTIEAETIGEDFMNSFITFTAETASVNTRNEGRDKHLRSEDFFNAEKYPTITFKPTKFELVDNDGSYEMYGDLTMGDITKNIKLDVEFGGVLKDPWGSAKAGFTINGKINRKDWNLNWNAALEGGGILVSEDVKINCEVQLVEVK